MINPGNIMSKGTFNRDIPLGRVFSFLTKNYIGVLSQKLNHLAIERHFYPLIVVEQGGGRTTQKELAEILNTDKATMVRMVDYLSDHGMLIRQTNPDDRREQHLVLTDKAKAIMPGIKSAIQHVNAAAMADMSDVEKEVFYALLSKVCKGLSSLPSDEILMEFTRSKK
jgi:MarR family transcriptional regulator for hemolysin